MTGFLHELLVYMIFSWKDLIIFFYICDVMPQVNKIPSKKEFLSSLKHILYYIWLTNIYCLINLRENKSLDATSVSPHVRSTTCTCLRVQYSFSLNLLVESLILLLMLACLTMTYWSWYCFSVKLLGWMLNHIYCKWLTECMYTKIYNIRAI